MTGKKTVKTAAGAPDAALLSPEEETSPAPEYRPQAPRTKITVGKLPFTVDISQLTVKTVGKATAKVKEQTYITGRLALPREWIGKQVIVMVVDAEAGTNADSIDRVQKGEGIKPRRRNTAQADK